MKHDDLFLFDNPGSPQHRQDGDAPWIHLMRVDSSFRKEAFYFEILWTVRPTTEHQSKPHSHEYLEYLGFFSGNPHSPYDLATDVEIWLDDEKYTFDKNCLVYIPAGVWHTPPLVRKVTWPLLMVAASPVTTYGQKVNRDPKWAHLPDPLEAVD
jgi:hypothetical protein